MKIQIIHTGKGGITKMLSKESKIRVLENFYAIDYVFFGEGLREVATCCPLIKEDYLSVKGALLSVLIEMLKLVDHSPEPFKGHVQTEQLQEMAKGSAKSAREAAQKVVMTEKARNDIKAELRESLEESNEVNIPALVEEKIREKAFNLAVDNLLVARILPESLDMNSLNKFEGKIIEDSYKVLRDNLSETANLILDSDE
jgi:hypothetical protein